MPPNQISLYLQRVLSNFAVEDADCLRCLRCGKDALSGARIDNRLGTWTVTALAHWQYFHYLPADGQPISIELPGGGDINMTGEPEEPTVETSEEESSEEAAEDGSMGDSGAGKSDDEAA